MRNIRALLLYSHKDGITHFFAKKKVFTYVENSGNKVELTEMSLLDLVGPTLLHPTNFQSYYNDSLEIINTLLEFDTVIIATSIYNFRPNPITQNLINKITVRNLTFDYNPNGTLNKLYAHAFRHIRISIVATSGTNENMLPPSAKQSLIGLADSFQFIGFEKIGLHFIPGMDMASMYSKTYEEKYQMFKQYISNDIDDDMNNPYNTRYITIREK